MMKLLAVALVATFAVAANAKSHAKKDCTDAKYAAKHADKCPAAAAPEAAAADKAATTPAAATAPAPTKNH